MEKGPLRPTFLLQMERVIVAAMCYAVKSRIINEELVLNRDTWSKWMRGLWDDTTLGEQLSKTSFYIVLYYFYYLLFIFIFFNGVWWLYGRKLSKDMPLASFRCRMGYLKLVVFGQENEAHNNILRQKSSRPVRVCVTNMIASSEALHAGL